jgi:hypothetical protein
MNTIAAMQAWSGTVRGASPYSARDSSGSARVLMGGDHPKPSCTRWRSWARARDRTMIWSWPAARTPMVDDQALDGQSALEP